MKKLKGLKKVVGAMNIGFKKICIDNNSGELYTFYNSSDYTQDPNEVEVYKNNYAGYLKITMKDIKEILFDLQKKGIVNKDIKINK